MSAAFRLELYSSCVYACSVAKLCPILQTHGLYPPVSSVHGISQAGILEWIAVYFSRGSSQSRDWTHVSWIRRLVLYPRATREARIHLSVLYESLIPSDVCGLYSPVKFEIICSVKSFTELSSDCSQWWRLHIWCGRHTDASEGLLKGREILKTTREIILFVFVN